MQLNAKIYIAGHRGLVGSAIHRNLLAKGYTNFALRTHTELELERQADITIRALTEMVALTVGYKGEIVWDATKQTCEDYLGKKAA